MKKEIIKIQPKQTGLPNPMHLEVQKTTRMNIFKQKKGKGSFTRKIKHKKINLEDIR